MDGIGLLAEAKVAGLVVRAEGDKLFIRGPKMAGHVAHRLLANKAAVLTALCDDSTNRCQQNLAALGKLASSVDVDSVDASRTAVLLVAKLSRFGLHLVRKFDGLVVLRPVGDFVRPLPADVESELESNWSAVAALAHSEVVEALEEIDCPPPCLTCSSLELWESGTGVWRCQHCDPPTRAMQWLCRGDRFTNPPSVAAYG